MLKHDFSFTKHFAWIEFNVITDHLRWMSFDINITHEICLHSFRVLLPFGMFLKMHNSYIEKKIRLKSPRIISLIRWKWCEINWNLIFLQNLTVKMFIYLLIAFERHMWYKKILCTHLVCLCWWWQQWKCYQNAKWHWMVCSDRESHLKILIIIFMLTSKWMEWVI